MQRCMAILKALALITLIVCGAGAFLLLLQISSAVKHADAAVALTAGHVDQAVDHLGATAGRAGKLVDDARVSVSNVNKAAIDERFYFEQQLPGLMDQAHGILGNVQRATADVDPLLIETRARIAGLEPVEKGTSDLFVGLNEMVRDPRIGASVGNVEAATVELAAAGREGNAAMGSVQAMAKDGEDEVHRLTHPRPLVSVADWTLKVVHAIGGWF